MATQLSPAVYRAMTVIDGKGFLRHSRRYVGKGSQLTDEFVSVLRASGLTAIGTTVGGSVPLQETLAFIAGIDAAIAARPGAVLRIEQYADIARARSTGALGVILDIQGTTELEEKVDNVAVLARAGVRTFQLTYNKAALVGDGCLENRNAGLSEFGHEVIAAIQSAHCLLDLSHAGRRTTAEAIVASRGPCAITHAGCNAIVPHPRNVDDSEIRAIADKGGVFGVYFMTYLRKAGQSVRADVIAHLEHALDVAGEDHVSLGTDNDVGPLVLDEAFRHYWRVDVCEARERKGIAAPNEGPEFFNYVPEYNVPDRFRLLADDLLARGHSLGRVEKIIGGNLDRLYREVFA